MDRKSRKSKEQKQNETKPSGCSFNSFGLKTISQERFQELLHYEEMKEKYKLAYDVVNEDRESLLEQLKEKEAEIQEKNDVIESQTRDIRYAELTRAQARQDRDDLRASLKLVQATNSDLRALIDKLQKSESTVKIQLKAEQSNAEHLEACNKDIIEKLLVASNESDAAQLKFKETQALFGDLQAKFDLTNQQNKSRIQDLMQQTRDMRLEIEDLENELVKWKSESVSSSIQSDPTVSTRMSEPTVSSRNKPDASSIVFEKSEVTRPPSGHKSRSLSAVDLEREVRESQLEALQSTNTLLRCQLDETTSELARVKTIYTG